MKKMTAAIVAVSVGLWLAACAEPASDAEIQQMCEHLIKLGGEFDATPAEVRVAKVTKDFSEQLKAVEEKRDSEIKAVEADREAKLATLKTDEEKAAIAPEFDTKKTAKADEYKAMIDKLNADKADMVKKAEELAKADADAAKEAVDKCVAENKGIGVSKELATCRIGVATTDEYWNKCK